MPLPAPLTPSCSSASKFLFFLFSLGTLRPRPRLDAKEGSFIY